MSTSSNNGGATSFSFGATEPVVQSSTDKADDNDEEDSKPYEPPTTEIVELEEPNAFYSIK